MADARSEPYDRDRFAPCVELPDEQSTDVIAAIIASLFYKYMCLLPAMAQLMGCLIDSTLLRYGAISEQHAMREDQLKSVILHYLDGITSVGDLGGMVDVGFIIERHMHTSGAIQRSGPEGNHQYWITADEPFVISSVLEA